MEKGHFGQYSGNARHSRTPVTKKNYRASVADDAAHIHYLKMDVMYDDHHGHSDENMTADEKHISKLAGDMKYDKKHHGSPAKQVDEREGGRVIQPFVDPGAPEGFVSDAREVVGTRVLSDLNEGTKKIMFGGKQIGTDERIEGIKTARKNLKNRNYSQSEIDAYNKNQATGATDYVNQY